MLPADGFKSEQSHGAANCPPVAASQASRAESAGVSERQQRKLDDLARKAPAKLEEVRRGEKSVHPYPSGLETDVPTLRKVLDGEAIVMLESLIARGAGGNNNPEGLGGHTSKKAEERGEPIVNGSTGTIDNSPASPAPLRGNTRQGAIRKLQRAAAGERRKNDGPNFPSRDVATDLLGKISRGELTCHAALKSIGYRQPPTPLQTVLRLLPELDAHDRLLVAHEPPRLAHPARPSPPAHPRPGRPSGCGRVPRSAGESW